MLSISEVILAVFSTGLVILFERAFPFILFSRKNPPKIINFIEKYIPPMVMAALLFYCIKDINFISESHLNPSGFIPYIVGITITIILHLWKRNSLLSIFGGTGIYMILIRIL